MTFFATRLVLSVISICVIVLAILKKRKIWRKRIFIIMSLLLFSFVELSGIAPIENIFLTFETPEAAINYYTMYREVLDVIYGKESCMVVYINTRNEYEVQYFPKTNEGYKLPSVWTVKRVSYYISAEGTFDINQIWGTNDYYLSGIYTFPEDIPELSDNIGTFFKCIELQDANIEGTYYNYAYLQGFTDNYILMISKKKIF